ncbi:MAG: UDP-N-acetylmuramoyl-L-alanine--D-glutamate ligase [Candidatus Saccharimonadales bacterium]
MKIAIAGFGLEGHANFDYWNRAGNELTIVDERTDTMDFPYGVRTLLGEGVFSQLNGFDIVVRTASLPPRKIHTTGKVWSATNEFFARCPAPIIGVTGTKGKGTTASLITSILRAAGKTVHLVGNIGVPALNELARIQPDDIVVYELSSFQLWDLEKSPHIAVVLMIEPDHLNVHADFAEYIDAKANIRRYQTMDDYCIYHPDNEYARKVALTSEVNTPGRYAVVDDGQVYVRDGHFFVYNTVICEVEALQLVGQHNIENACAAISVALRFTVNYQEIDQGLRDFEGLPHRLEFVREVAGVAYYNDSFSSAPGATVAAIRSFTRPEILILGGIDKGADFTQLAEVISQVQNIKKLVIIGEIRHQLAVFLEERGIEKPIFISDAKTMAEVVAAARDEATDGDVIILSPGCASFDMFKNFYDRGDQFRFVVQNL